MLFHIFLLDAELNSLGVEPINLGLVFSCDMDCSQHPPNNKNRASTLPNKERGRLDNGGEDVCQFFGENLALINLFPIFVWLDIELVDNIIDTFDLLDVVQCQKKTKNMSSSVYCGRISICNVLALPRTNLLCIKNAGTQWTMVSYLKK